MCHELYHIDPDLRAVANRLAGLPDANTPELRERAAKIAKLLLTRATAEGLRWFVEGSTVISNQEYELLYVRLRSITARIAQEAHALRYAAETDNDDVPW